MLYHHMREIIIKIKDEDYLNFQTIANESGLKVDEKISQIIVLIKALTENKKLKNTLCVVLFIKSNATMCTLKLVWFFTD